MKKFGFVLKVAFISVLVSLLIVLSVGTPTFSWFDRPQELSGNGLEYGISSTTFKDSQNNQGLYAYNGENVTITANQYSSDGTSYSDEGAIYPFLTSARTLARGQRDFYKTTLKNNGSVAQNVSLYLTRLATSGNSGELAVGVNSPVKSYKDYSVLASGNNLNSATKVAYTENPEKIRVYLNPKNAWTYAYSIGPDQYTVEARYGNTGSGTYSDMTFNGRDGDGNPIYYLDIYRDSTFIQFHVKGNPDNWSWTETKNITFSSKQSVVFWAEQDHGTDDGSGHLKLGSNNVDGPYFNNVFNNSTVVYMRSPLDMSYTKDTDYKGKSASYSSSNTNVFTVNASSGVVTPVAAGSATLTVTIKGGQYSDPKTYASTVTVRNLVTGTVGVDDVPVVKNILIPAGEEVNIRWFIMNDKDATSSVTYTLSGVYIGL